MYDLTALRERLRTQRPVPFAASHSGVMWVTS